MKGTRYIQPRIASILTALLLLAALPGAMAGAAEMRVNPPSGGVAVFVLPVADSALGALGIESAAALRDSFDRCGRFLPVEEHQLRWAFRGAESGAEADFYGRAARLLDVDLYVVVALSRMGEVYGATMRVVPRRGDLAHLERVVRFESRIMVNIPLRLAKAAASLHEGLPVNAAVVAHLDSDRYLIGAGQWHGLGAGTYPTRDHGTVEVLVTGRYESVVRMPSAKPGTEAKIVIPIYPDARGRSSLYALRISENTIARYGAGSTLLKDADPRKRYIEGACIINPGGNACLPVYGAFLATGYLGFRDPKADVPGLAVSGSVLALQFSLPSFLSGFSVHFFPWERDGDKTRDMQRLQAVMWATAPLTISAAYFDQLAAQFSRSGALPPFFEDRDAFAALCSAVVPGGGQFYKGRRLAGWGFFISEMALGACSAYYFDDRDRGRLLLAALGAVKLADIAGAFFMRTGYDVYNRETTGDQAALVPFLQMSEMPGGEDVVMLGMSYRP
ncbi:MAG TPA: hypothetical protein VLM75_10410 [Spirochaetota bacterium]|nr:hypothetical protein [Spirochaetota bacterium]